MDFPWGDTRRFNSGSRFMRQHFGGRMQRLAIDAGFTCPNRDGTRGTGGCTYCLNTAFNPSYCTPQKSITQQIEDGILFHQKRRGTPYGYLAYFQAFSNTYAPIELLKSKYEEALQHTAIQGIIIATRPDCLYEAVLDYLEELQQRTFVSLEIGMESCRDATLRRIRRGHNLTCAVEAIERCASHHLPVGTHLIFGLPGETPEHWIDDIALLNALPLHHIKFHQLQIFKNTLIEKEFQEHPEAFHRFTPEQYVHFMADYLERLRPDIIVDRLAGEVPPKYLAVTNWHHLKYEDIVKQVENELERRNSWQGKCFTPPYNLEEK